MTKYVIRDMSLLEEKRYLTTTGWSSNTEEARKFDGLSTAIMFASFANIQNFIVDPIDVRTEDKDANNGPN